VGFFSAIAFDPAFPDIWLGPCTAIYPRRRPRVLHAVETGTESKQPMLAFIFNGENMLVDLLCDTLSRWQQNGAVLCARRRRFIMGTLLRG
jgi:hypothetical protein